ncbi:uncharacterized protein BJ171DRAFT_494190 [Polychytrium aggregatum]|uniref:uncharacterized protein n=1 Tax=Polychytrium aggregatum TaxID=110093 RepID=UPI0022FEEF66|nr:uncharacterized protein BJ171DRAFT_494190 [Polychytrium aggregatum]KAI9207300.1 hypothetical protein BJ171DRAFT_494190 [Polychytrium aggregatum]
MLTARTVYDEPHRTRRPSSHISSFTPELDPPSLHVSAAYLSMADKRRKILIALDDSESARYALAWSMENVIDSTRDHVVLLSVGIFHDRWNELFVAAMGPAYTQENREQLEMQAEDFSRKILNDATKVIQEHASNLNDGASISHEIFALKGGDPRDVIVDFCHNMNADMLIVGSRGMSNLGRALVGSVSEYLVHHAPCPVLVVRPSGQA